MRFVKTARPCNFEPPPVYFTHLPKTGGTALGHWLRIGYCRNDYVDLRAEELDCLPVTELGRFRCFHSWHLGCALYDRLKCPTQLQSAVILRCFL